LILVQVLELPLDRADECVQAAVYAFEADAKFGYVSAEFEPDDAVVLPADVRFSGQNDADFRCVDDLDLCVADDLDLCVADDLDPYVADGLDPCVADDLDPYVADGLDPYVADARIRQFVNASAYVVRGFYYVGSL
jgi:hypothetical protein